MLRDQLSETSGKASSILFCGNDPEKKLREWTHRGKSCVGRFVAGSRLTQALRSGLQTRYYHSLRMLLHTASAGRLRFLPSAGRDCSLSEGIDLGDKLLG
jgi:hypothetical protein